MKHLAQKLIELDMDLLGSILQAGKLPPIELVKENRELLAKSIKDTDSNIHQKKWLLEDLDAMIFNVEQANGQQDVWDIIMDECEKYPHLRLVK